MKYLIAFSLLLLSLTLSAQGKTLDIPLSEPGKRGVLHVDVKTGPVVIKGTARQNVMVRYETADDKKNKFKQKEKGSGMRKISSGNLQMEIAENQNEVYIESSSWNRAVSIYVEVPTDFDLNIETYNNGTIEVDNVHGELELESYNGSVRATNVSGSLLASTYNGDIKAHFNEVKPNTPMAYSTYNGDIDLTFPKGISADFKMRTDDGDIYSDFEMKISDKPKEQSTKRNSSGIYKVIIDEWTFGQIGGGGPENSMKTYHGNIYIRQGE